MRSSRVTKIKLPFWDPSVISIRTGFSVQVFLILNLEFFYTDFFLLSMEKKTAVILKFWCNIDAGFFFITPSLLQTEKDTLIYTTDY